MRANVLVIRAASVSDAPRPPLPSASGAGASALDGRLRPPPLPSRRAGNAGIPRVVQASRDPRESGGSARARTAPALGTGARALHGSGAPGAGQGVLASRTESHTQASAHAAPQAETEERTWQAQLARAKQQAEAEERDGQVQLARAKTQAEAEEREWQAQLARAKAQAVEVRAGARERTGEARAGARDRGGQVDARAGARARNEVEEHDWDALRARAEAAARSAEAAARSAEAAARSAQAAAQSAQAAARGAAISPLRSLAPAPSIGPRGAVADSPEEEQREWAERIARARAGALGTAARAARSGVQSPRIVLWP